MVSNDKNRKHSEWLIMIYLAGDNSLSANSIAFLQELEDAGHDNNVRVLAGFDSATPLPKGARYVEINRHLDDPGPFGNMKWDLHNDLVTPGSIVITPDFCQPLGSATPKPSGPTAEEALARFLDFARQNYVAKRYMLILFGHGTLVAGNTFLADTNPPSFLKLDAFARILRRHFRRKIDILGFDNCVMNGIETAVEIGRQVEFTIGSQGLMLALGWPFGKIIKKIRRNFDIPTKELVEKILRVCARNLLDFALMERSSEQAICDVTKFGANDRFISAVRELSHRMQAGLEIIKQTGEVRFPIVRDVLRLARLETQSYFGETFVDLYDFCELTVLRANDVLGSLNSLVNDRFPDSIPKKEENKDLFVKRLLLKWPDMNALRNIVEAAWKVLKAFRDEKIVPRAYYVGPQLQYSHGVSIFFPWTLPEGPLTFKPARGSGRHPREFEVETPFDVYQKYRFADAEHGDWARFLDAFFRATLRNVRLVELDYKENDKVFFVGDPLANREHKVVAVDLQKSSSDTGDEDECSCPSIKNYPRRFYISPADCKRKLPVFGLPGSPRPTESNVIEAPGTVSYLGWNIRGVVAEEIGLPLNTPAELPEQSPKKK